MNVQIRHAVKQDMPIVLDLIKELAIYEQAEEEVVNRVQWLEKYGTQDNTLFTVILAQFNGEVIGMVLYYYCFSSWKGKMLYIDDIVVTKKFRRKGVGRVLFDFLMKEAKMEEAQQVRFHVLDWNEPALNFYKKYFKLSIEKKWLTCKIDIEGINQKTA